MTSGRHGMKARLLLDSSVSRALAAWDDAALCGVEHGNDAGECSAGVGTV